jgi:hypothetical protein
VLAHQVAHSVPDLFTLKLSLFSKMVIVPARMDSHRAPSPRPDRFRPLTDEEARVSGFRSAAGIEVSETATFDDVVSSGPFKLFKPR